MTTQSHCEDKENIAPMHVLGGHPCIGKACGPAESHLALRNPDLYRAKREYRSPDGFKNFPGIFMT